MITNPLVYSKEEVLLKDWIYFKKSLEEEEIISSSLPFGKTLTITLFCDKRLLVDEAQVLLIYDKTKKQTKRQHTPTTYTKPRTTKNTNPKQMRFTNSRNPSEEIPQTTKKPTQQCKKRSNTPIIPILPK